MGYFKDTLRGVSWMGGLRLFSRGLAVVKTIVLARVLSPSQFGLYGIAFLVLGFLEIIFETGVNVVLIQEEGNTDDYISSAWIVSILRGITVALLIFFFAPLISSFFSSPDSLNLIRLIALVPFIRGFINPAIVKFQKELKFNKEFWFRGALFFVDAGVAISLGVITGSEKALIWGMICSALLEVIISFVIVSPRPKLSLDTNKAKKIIGRGKWITFAGTFEYLFQHLDDIVVGKVLGTSLLGLYQQAYRISTVPIQEVSEVFNKVTFPTYIKIEADKARLKRAYIKVLATIALLVIPFGLILFFFADEVVLILLGNNWLSAVPALKVLAIYGIIKSFLYTAYPVFLSIRRQELVTLVTLVGIIGMGVVLYPLIVSYSIVGAGIATIVGTLVAYPFAAYHLAKIFKDGKNA